MYRVLMCAAAGALFISTAKADETVKWRHVHHYASNQSQQVGNGHAVGAIRMPGIAFFPDGSIGTSLVIGTYDAGPNSVSTSRGYYTVTFADGSELWLTWTGGNKVTVPGKLATANGTAIVIGGKGRYEGAKGEGTFKGETVQSRTSACQHNPCKQ